MSIFETIGKFLVKNSPTILSGLAVTGLISTAVLAVKATPQALREINRYEAESVLNGLEPSDSGRVKAVYKLYLPALSVAVASVTCIVFSNAIHIRRNVAISSAFTMVERAATAYQEKVIEVAGEKVHEDVKQALAKDRVVENFDRQTTEVMITDGGGTLCYDGTTGRYFLSSIDALQKAENAINHDLVNGFGTWVELNEFYYKIGLPGVKFGDWLGWEPDQLVELEFTTVLAPNDEPCIVVDFKVAPKRSPWY